MAQRSQGSLDRTMCPLCSTAFWLHGTECGHRKTSQSLLHPPPPPSAQAAAATGAAVDSPRQAGLSPPAVSAALMMDERNRLRSFSGWPADHIVSPTRLAAAGLYYTGTSDRTKCAFCHFTFNNWRRGDDPAVRHRRWCPTCEFARGLRGDDEEPVLSCRYTSPAASKAPTYLQDWRKRLGTFDNWPVHMKRPSPKDLAQAGFYFVGGVGLDSDSVKCFQCGVVLSGWPMGEDPWIQHARFSPGCAFLEASKGAGFVANVQQYYHHQQKQLERSEKLAEQSPRRARPPTPDESPPAAEVQSAGTRPTNTRRERRSQREQAGASSQTLEGRFLEALAFRPTGNAASSSTARGRDDATTMAVSGPQGPDGRVTFEEYIRCRACGSRDMVRACWPCCHLCMCESCSLQPVDACPVCGTAVSGTYLTLLP